MPSFNLTLTGEADIGGGSASWSSSGGNFPWICSPDPLGTTSNTLQISFSGGSFPAGVTITGWAIGFAKDASSGGNIWDVSITTSLGGTGFPTNEAATGTLWPPTTGTSTYGGSTDTWGGSVPTAANVIAHGGSFGIAIKTDGTAGTGFVRGSATFTVYYTGGFDPATLPPSVDWQPRRRFRPIAPYRRVIRDFDFNKIYTYNIKL